MKVSVKPGDPSHLVDDGLGFGVLAELQIGIDLVVHGVQLVVRNPRPLWRHARTSVFDAIDSVQ